MTPARFLDQPLRVLSRPLQRRRAQPLRLVTGVLQELVGFRGGLLQYCSCSCAASSSARRAFSASASPCAIFSRRVFRFAMSGRSRNAVDDPRDDEEVDDLRRERNRVEVESPEGFHGDVPPPIAR